MDELIDGFRDAKGEWRPKEATKIAPVWAMPPRIGAVLRWLPGYFLPWNAIFGLTAVVFWVWIVPPVDVMQSLSIGWAAYLYAVNIAMIVAFYGAMELRLYVRRHQGTRFKFNPEFPEDKHSKFFWFSSQTKDNMLRSLAFGVTIWTAIEVLVLWAFANGWVPWLTLANNPVWLIVLALIVPVIHELHFYCIHRLIHTRWLYKHVHSVHHRSVNPSPWSSLSMHPVEHLLYFMSGAYHLILPSNPLLALYQMHYAGVGAIAGHIGFDRIEIGNDRAVDAHAFTHYLHHKYFEVNYGDGLVPLDKVFGTWHDGSEEAGARLRERLKARRARERS